MVDPQRDTGTFPIPQPFNAAGNFFALLLLLAGPLVAGLLIGRVLVHPRPLTVRAGAYITAAMYALYISPWASAIIFD